MELKELSVDIFACNISLQMAIDNLHLLYHIKEDINSVGAIDGLSTSLYELTHCSVGSSTIATPKEIERTCHISWTVWMKGIFMYDIAKK